jgi:PAS domain-containing protein
MFGTVQDITERKTAEGKIREQEAELRQILDLTRNLFRYTAPATNGLHTNRLALD